MIFVRHCADLSVWIISGSFFLVILLTLSWRVLCSSAGKRVVCSGVKCKRLEICLTIDGVSACGCREKCPSRVRPICGNDGITYDNQCELNRAACISGSRIRRKFKGTCAGKELWSSYSISTIAYIYWATPLGRHLFCKWRVSPSSDRLHIQMWLHRVDVISLSIIICLGAIIGDINTVGFVSLNACVVCDALAPSCATVH